MDHINHLAKKKKELVVHRLPDCCHRQLHDALGGGRKVDVVLDPNGEDSLSMDVTCWVNVGKCWENVGLMLVKQ
jgi:hypothetical protein